MAIEISAATAARYLRIPLEQMLLNARRLDHIQLNDKPHGEHTNSVAALIIHSCAVAEFWLGHVGRGLPTDRVRDDEFTAVAGIGELEDLVDRTIRRSAEHAAAIASGDTTAAEPDPADDVRAFLYEDDRSDGSLYLHVVEELFQHLGHVELTIDALLADGESA